MLGSNMFPGTKKIESIERSMDFTKDNIQTTDKGAAKSYADIIANLVNSPNDIIIKKLQEIKVNKKLFHCVCKGLPKSKSFRGNIQVSRIPRIHKLGYNARDHNSFVAQYFETNSNFRQGYVRACKGKLCFLIALHTEVEHPDIKQQQTVPLLQGTTECPDGFEKVAEHGRNICKHIMKCKPTRHLRVLADMDGAYYGKQVHKYYGVGFSSQYTVQQTAVLEFIKIPSLTNIVGTYAGDDAVSNILPEVLSTNLLDSVRQTCIQAVRGKDDFYYYGCPNQIFDGKGSASWTGNPGPQTSNPAITCTYTRKDGEKNHDCQNKVIDHRIEAILMFFKIVSRYKERFNNYLSIHFLLKCLPELIDIYDGPSLRGRAQMNRNQLLHFLSNIKHGTVVNGIKYIYTRGLKEMNHIKMMCVEYLEKMLDGDLEHSQTEYNHLDFLQKLYHEVIAYKEKHEITDARELVRMMQSDGIKYITLLDLKIYMEDHGVTLGVIDNEGSNDDINLDSSFHLLLMANVDDEASLVHLKKGLANAYKGIARHLGTKLFKYKVAPNYIATLNPKVDDWISSFGVEDVLHAVFLRTMVDAVANTIIKLYELMDMKYNGSRLASFVNYVKKNAGLDISKNPRCSGKHYHCFKYLKRAHGALALNFLQLDWGLFLNDKPIEQQAVRWLQAEAHFITEMLVFSLKPQQDFKYNNANKMKQDLSTAVNNTWDIMYQIAPPYKIVSKKRGGGRPIYFHPLGTLSAHYTKVHFTSKFKKRGVTADESTAMMEYKQGTRRRREHKIFKGRNRLNKLNRHGEALQNIYMCDKFQFDNKGYIELQLKKIKQREKRDQLLRFLPAKTKAIKAHKAVNNCRGGRSYSNTRLPGCKIFAESYESVYKSYFENNSNINDDDNMEEESLDANTESIQESAGANAQCPVNSEAVGEESTDSDLEDILLNVT
eukprot:g3732.t1